MSLTYQRIKKQDLLLTATLYEKLPKDDLIAYLMKLKGDQFNLLDSWNYAELEAAIKEFANEKTVIVQIDQAPDSEIVVKARSNNGLVVNDEFNYREFIKCKQLPGNQVSGYLKQNPNVILQPKIPEYLIVDEGTFSPKYVNYRVEIQGLDSSVWRRVEHFHWLADSLALQFPDSLIPPLPARTLIRKFTPAHLSKRSKMLEQFLSALLSNNLLRQSDLVEGFVLQEDEIKFKQLMVASSVLKQPLIYSEYGCMDGQVQVEYNPVMTQFFLDMNNYLLHSNDVYKELTDNSRHLVDSLNDFQDKVKKLGTNVTQLKDLTKSFNSKSIVGSIPLVEFAYTLLEEYLLEWHQNLNGLKNTLNENLYEFFRFQRDMQSKCVDLINNRNKAASKYQKEFQDLMKKKMKYFTQEPIEKWELSTDVDRVKLQTNKELAIPYMFPNQTMEVNEYKIKYGYVNRQSYEQITQYFDNKGVLYVTRLKNMSLRKKENVETNYKTLETIAKQLEAILEMRNGAHENLELRQEWVDQYYYPYSITNILKS